MIRATTELLASRGLSGSSVDAISRRAGVVKSALYWHFGSKEGLIAATIEQIGRRWVAEIEADVMRGTDRPLEPFAEGTARLLRDDDALLRALIAASIEDPEEAPERRQAVRAFLEQAHAAIVRGSEHAAPGVASPEAIADLAINFLIGAAVRHLLDRDPEMTQRALDLLSRHLRFEASWQLRHPEEEG